MSATLSKPVIIFLRVNSRRMAGSGYEEIHLIPAAGLQLQPMRVGKIHQRSSIFQVQLFKDVIPVHLHGFK